MVAKNLQFFILCFWSILRPSWSVLMHSMGILDVFECFWCSGMQIPISLVSNHAIILAPLGWVGSTSSIRQIAVWIGTSSIFRPTSVWCGIQETSRPIHSRSRHAVGSAHCTLDPVSVSGGFFRRVVYHFAWNSFLSQHAGVQEISWWRC